jgi:hypothetical protein
MGCAHRRSNGRISRLYVRDSLRTGVLCPLPHTGSTAVSTLNAGPPAAATRMAFRDPLFLQNGLLFLPQVLLAASRAARHLVLLNLQTLQQSLITEHTREYQLPCLRTLDHYFSHSDPPPKGLGPETDPQPRPCVLTCALFYHALGHPGQVIRTTLERAAGPYESRVRDIRKQQPVRSNPARISFVRSIMDPFRLIHPTPSPPLSDRA